MSEQSTHKFKVGDKVEVCERYGFRSQEASDPVKWQGTIVRETKTQWVVLGGLSGYTRNFRKLDGEQVTWQLHLGDCIEGMRAMVARLGSHRYIRPVNPVTLTEGE